MNLKFSHERNPHAAQRIYDVIEQAELAYRLAGTPHAETYRREQNKHQGLTRRVLAKLAALGPKAATATDHFWKAYGA